LIMGLAGYRQYDGDILFEGASIKALPIHERAQRGITLAWQEPARFEGLLVKDFILASAKEKTEGRVKKVLDYVGLNPDLYFSRKVDKTLSGGERKRIELASILAMKPKLVLMDEPDSGIDVEALEKIFQALRYLKENQATIIMITHSLTVLQQADHAFLLCCGQLADQGSVYKIAQYFEKNCLPCIDPNPTQLAAMENQ
ncbi:MAG: ATP-binding cassette domain-containing protein, partial [Candidatus Omnitrophica bacterium]|nr:ATP-binding cassette domain-containing protein [Candidatus Omnitrophota bacterium]